MATDAASSNAQRFVDKVVCITGGAGTFGRVGARYFAREGAKVVLMDLSEEKLQEAEAEMELPEGGDRRVLSVECDITDEEAVKAAVENAVTTFGRVDLLWNNAGYQGEMKPTDEYSSEDFARVMQINVTGSFIVMKAVANAMKASGGGVIVNTASVAGISCTPTMIAYGASKAAIIALTKTASKDLAPHNIRVNAVSPALIGPGYMWERQNELHAASGSPYFPRDTEAAKKQMIEGVPMKRLGTTEEVVRSVAFLLSDDASYTTGHNLVISGGVA